MYQHNQGGENRFSIFSSTLLRVAGAVGRRSAAMASAWLLLMVASWFNPAHAAVSPCGTISATVVSGQQVQITFNINHCSDFGWAGVITAPSHGRVEGDNVGGGRDGYITYSSDGLGATSDTFTVSDDSLNVMTFNITITAPPTPLVMSPTVSASPTIGQSFSQQLNTTGGTAPYTYVLATGSLPAGISMNANGTFSGTPTERATYNFSVRSTDSTSPTPYTVTRGYQMAVGSATLVTTPATLPNGMVSVAYSQQLSSSGGTAPYTYVVDGGFSLPPGLQLSTTGLISGTPTTAGTTSVRFVAKDSTTGTATETASATYSFVIDPLPPPPIAGAASVNVTYNANATPVTLVLSGGTAASVSIGTAPAHGTATVNGTAITYKPATGYNGPDSFTYRATNPGGTSAPATVSVTMTAPTVTVMPGVTTLSATGGSAFSQTFSASGGAGPYTYSVSGTLPNGVSLNSVSGGLSGTPTQAGSYPITISATDSSTGTAVTGARSYTLDVSAPTITVSAVAATFQRGVPVSQQYSASGGSGSYTYSVSTGTVPTGLTLAPSTGVLSGIPTVAGTYFFTVRATDGNNFTGQQAMAVTVGAGAPVTSASNASVTYNASATIPISTTGGTPTSLNVVSGPAHGTITVLSASSFSYTPTIGYAGTDTFSYTATNAVGTSSAATVSITVAAPTLSLSPVGASLSGMVGVAFSQVFTGSGGAATYSYSLSGSLPTGMTFSAGTLSGVPTQAGSFPITVTTQDSSTGLGPFSTSRNYTLTIGAPSLGISPSVLTAPEVGISYSQQLSTSGGVTPYTYVVSTGTLPSGLSLSSTGLITGIPTAAGPYNFSVTSTDASSFAVTANYSGSVGAGKPVAGNASAPVAYGSSGNSIAAVLSGGVATSLGVTTAPAHGVATVNGATGFSYTPTAGYYGTDSFSYTATNAVGTSGIATVSITVAAPTVVITPSTTWSASQGSSYAQTLTWSGGSAPYSTISVTGLPSGLTFSTNTTAAMISGIPTQNGSFSVTASATDSSTPTPVVKSQVFTLVVGQAVPVAVADSATTNANQAVTIPVTTNDSGAITSVMVTTGPTHGTAVVSGLSVLYTPVTNYFGGDSFTYTATGPGGTSTAAAVSVTVTALGVPTSAPQSAAVQPGQSVTLHVGAAAANGPITTVLVVGAPSSGSATVNGSDIIYTAAAGFSGTVQFSYTLSNAFGTSAPISATVSVGAVPVAANQSGSGAAASTVLVNLMTGATGGPFTAATLGAMTPSNAGTAVIVDTGSGSNHVYQLRFTAAAAFAGNVTISYTLANLGGTSSAATVNITIAARTSAANDVQVKGIVAAHGQSANRFATAQLGNFSRRLESLHGSGWAPSSFGLGFAQPTAPVKPLLAQWSEDEVDRVVGSPLQTGMRRVGWPLTSQRDPASRVESKLAAASSKEVSALPELPARPDQARQELSLWIAGTVDFGQRNARGQQEGFRFTTNGVSMGADYRINDQLTVGAGVGYSRDRSDIGENGSKSIGQSVVAALYGSVRPTPNIFVDGMLGYGALSFDSTRYVTDDGSLASGQRSGRQVFVALAGGYEFRGENWLWSPYGKIDLASTTLAQYTETAAANNALTYFKQRVRTSSGTLGLRSEGQYLSRVGTWTPRGRIEYRRQFSGAGEAGIAYADLASSGPAYVIRSDDSFTGNWTAGMGARLLMPNGISLIVDYSTNLNVGQGRYSSVLFGVNVPLR
ncbi:putative Ig domain-containing protein [Herbaspirillum sp. alder98]|uniref:putative Ig domain-containing protein n=1 Tax=Herbaspirillum sp. alder98 TaxID=2913096 RepID=UPI001CD8FBA7|nr:putative Ig domain-containing protein [Herbaspirillum sp. alder98]MCA1326899.1 putative Ig domain-containing protein [Herbaspirillum sp. alder98]